MGKNLSQIGAKILSEEAVEKLLPRYNDIYKDIEQMRNDFNEEKCSRDMNNCTEIKHSKFDNNIVNDNIISILGERGSGKSSILKTIINKLNSESEKENDILLPLIMPEVMESNDLIGWLIGYFDKIVKELKKDFKNSNYSLQKKRFDYISNYDNKHKNFDECINNDKLECPILKPYKKWVSTYTKRLTDYKDIIKNNFNGNREYEEEFSEYLLSDIGLLDDFRNFIRILIGYIKSKENEKPIIFIFFDDLDLIPYNSVKMLETIIVYLNQPNIVTFISGDIENFHERILLNYLRKDQILNSLLYNDKFRIGNINRSAKLSRSNLANDFLKKLLVPAYRYNIAEYSLKEKTKFTSGEESSEGNNSNSKDKFSDLLDNFCNQIIKNDKIYTVDNVNYHIFDNKPRGLINVYKYLQNKTFVKKDPIDKEHKEIKKEIKNNELIIEELKVFRDLIITCNDKVNLYLSMLRKYIIFEEEKNDIVLKVNYGGLNDLDLYNKDGEKDLIRSKIEIFRLIMFFDDFLNSKKISNENNDLNSKKISAQEKDLRFELSNVLNRLVALESNVENLNIFNPVIFSPKLQFTILEEITNNISFRGLSQINKLEIWEKLTCSFGSSQEGDSDIIKLEKGYDFLNENAFENYEWTSNYMSLYKNYNLNKADSDILVVETILNKFYLTKFEKELLSIDSEIEITSDESKVQILDELSKIFYPEEVINTIVNYNPSKRKSDYSKLDNDLIMKIYGIRFQLKEIELSSEELSESQINKIYDLESLNEESKSILESEKSFMKTLLFKLLTLDEDELTNRINGLRYEIDLSYAHVIMDRLSDLYIRIVESTIGVYEKDDNSEYIEIKKKYEDLLDVSKKNKEGNFYYIEDYMGLASSDINISGSTNIREMLIDWVKESMILEEKIVKFLPYDLEVEENSLFNSLNEDLDELIKELKLLIYKERVRAIDSNASVYEKILILIEAENDNRIYGVYKNIVNIDIDIALSKIIQLNTTVENKKNLNDDKIKRENSIDIIEKLTDDTVFKRIIRKKENKEIYSQIIILLKNNKVKSDYLFERKLNYLLDNLEVGLSPKEYTSIIEELKNISKINYEDLFYAIEEISKANSFLFNISKDELVNYVKLLSDLVMIFKNLKGEDNDKENKKVTLEKYEMIFNIRKIVSR